MSRTKHFPKIIAHRGYGYRHAENTVQALKAAVAAEVEMIEIDVHETRDGRFIVYHDHSFNADTPPWGNLTYSQIQNLPINKGQAPLLSECLKVIDSIPVDLDIKSYVNLENLCRKLSTISIQQSSFVSSREYNLLKQLHMRAVQIPLFLIVSISPRLSPRQNIRNTSLCIAPQLLPQFLAGIAVYHFLVRHSTVNSLKRKGKSVFVWTVDDHRKMEKYISWGVEGIITNYPDRLQKLKDPHANKLKPGSCKIKTQKSKPKNQSANDQ